MKVSRPWALYVGGLVVLWLGLASPCPPPCKCPPSQGLSCRGCPTDYLTVGNDTPSLSVSGCKDILYLLRLHRPLPPDKQATKNSLQTLQITDSFLEKIPESYVSEVYGIQKLVMSNNSIDTIDVGLEAKNLTHLDLSLNYLSYIKNSTFAKMSNIVFLNLGSNRIQNLSVHAFIGLSRLVHLDLSTNNLTYLMDAIFLPLVSLQQLNLSSNKLEALSEKCFGSLLLLQQLDVSYNRLTSVAPGTLQFLPNLAKLLLADNPQLRPDAQIFVGTGRRLQQVDASRTGLKRVPEALTHSVRYLSLAGNRIATLRCGDLDGYPLLYMLDFADNIIENVEDDALGRLEMISRLYLNRNKLRSVPKMLPDKLSYLSLDTNMIVNLTTADFVSLIGLKVLLLSNNLISFIQENTFEQLASLEVLDVSNNPLKALTPNTFGGPVALKDFRIAYVDISLPAKDISFPVPSPERIESLHLQHSPGLTRELMADTAALAAMSRLEYLDISFSNVTNIRSDLLHFLPQLKILKLDGNSVNCTEMNWLADWMRNNLEDQYKQAKCVSPLSWAGWLIVDLPSIIKNESLSNTTVTPNTLFSSLMLNKKATINSKINEDHLKQLNTSTINMRESGINDFHNNPKSDEIELPNMNQNKNTKVFLEVEQNKQPDSSSSIYIKPFKQNLLPTEKEKNENVGPNPVLSGRKSFKQLNTEMNGEVVMFSEGEKKSKEINKTTVATGSAKNTSDKKLIEIFAQLSHRDENSLNMSKQQKGDPAKQKSVSMCTVTGNLNGTENKSKCSQHPEIAPVPPENVENKSTGREKFIYRKNGNNKSGTDVKPKKSKYVSRPNERQNTTKILRGKDAERNETAIKTRQQANQTRVIGSPDPLVPEHGNLYQHNLHGPMLLDTSNEETSRKTSTETKSVKIIEIKKPAPTERKSVIENSNERNQKYDNAKKASVNTKIKDVVDVKDIFENKFGEQGGENASEFQTSRYRAEASGASGLGIGALVGVCGAACAALAGACLVRRRPRPHGQGGPEMMEVQTITAVGELW